MSPYPDVPNADLLDRIPLDARVVLDVGCGTGALGAAYRRFNPRARLLGIDKDPEAAAIAAHRLDHVAALDVEATPLPFDLPSGLDCVIYGDILEHLQDPWTLLRRHAEVLTNDGTVLICVPNVEHWSFAAHLLRGDWAYAPTGLMDETHLRWFSLDSMRGALLDAGLALCDVHPRIFDAEQARAFAMAMRPGLQALGVDAQEYLNRAAPLQYLWRARRRPRARLTLAATMLEPVGGVSHTRVVYPLQALARDPSVQAQLITLPNLPETEPDAPRVCVLHRPALVGPQARATIETLLKRDWVIVTEFDDHPDFFRVFQDPSHLSFRGVHALQTSTEALASVLRTRNPEVMVFPNAARALPEPANFQATDHVTLFFGALNREPDWEKLMPAINAAAAMNERLHFEVVHDRAFFDALDTPHKRFTATCDHDTYMRLLGGCEICFMPLSDTPFNRAKSDLKFVEAGACRVAALASEVVYVDTIEEGRTGLIFRDAEELQALLTRLVMMPDIARDLGEAARAYVARQRMLAYQVAPRIAWYRSLWERRAALGAALRARLAEPALADAPAE